MAAESTRPGGDPDRTRTTAGEATAGGGDNRSAVLWVFPEYGRVSSTTTALTIGRGADVGCQLPGDEISRLHARLSAVGPGYAVADLGSRNGTRVGGRVIEGPTIVGPGEVLRLGDWVGVVVAGLPERPVFTELSPGLLGGPTLAAALAPARRLAPRLSAMVLQGETGTGKECAARAVHAWSGRAGPYVALDCASVPQTLAEAELFGHRRGAFTGADTARRGCFRGADGGTLLLDEFLELPTQLQPKLLRALQERQVKPVGEDRSEPVDVLVIAALQSELSAAVAGGRIRRDLAERLRGLSLCLPPLRERREDIVPLMCHFLAEGGATGTIDAALSERLSLHDFPGNVRELSSLARRMALEHPRQRPLGLRQLPPDFVLAAPMDAGMGEGPALDASGPAPGHAAPDAADAREAERARMRAALREALQAHGGVVARAARALGISRQRAYRLLDGEHGD